MRKESPILLEDPMIIPHDQHAFEETTEDESAAGVWTIIIGAVLVVVGLVLLFSPFLR